MNQINVAMLKGNLTHDPYFDIIPGSNTEVMKFYLAVDLPPGLALSYLLGNVVQPPFFNRFGEENRPFMRLSLAVERPLFRRQKGRHVDFLDAVAYDDAALFAYPYLQPGSRILVCGNLRSRKYQGNTLVELVAGTDDFTFLSKIRWQEGDAERERLLSEREQHEQVSGDNEEKSRDQYGGGFFRVVAYGNLARTCYPYLQVGSKVFVRGELQSRKIEDKKTGGMKTVFEIVAQEITFLRNIAWQEGDRAQVIQEASA